MMKSRCSPPRPGTPVAQRMAAKRARHIATTFTSGGATPGESTATTLATRRATSGTESSKTGQTAATTKLARRCPGSAPFRLQTRSAPGWYTRPKIVACRHSWHHCTRLHAANPAPRMASPSAAIPPEHSWAMRHARSTASRCPGGRPPSSIIRRRALAEQVCMRHRVGNLRPDYRPPGPRHDGLPQQSTGGGSAATCRVCRSHGLNNRLWSRPPKASGSFSGETAIPFWSAATP